MFSSPSQSCQCCAENRACGGEINHEWNVHLVYNQDSIDSAQLRSIIESEEAKCSGSCEITAPLAPLQFSYGSASQASGRLEIAQTDLEAALRDYPCFTLDLVSHRPEISEYE